MTKTIEVHLARHGKQRTGFASNYFPRKMLDNLNEELSKSSVQPSAEDLKKINQEFSQYLYCQLDPKIFTDVELTPVGIKQAQYLAQKLHENDVQFDRISASPVKRATQTASHIAHFFQTQSQGQPQTKKTIHINGNFREKYDGVREKIFLDAVSKLNERQDFVDKLGLSVELNMDRSENYLDGKKWGEEKESDEVIAQRVEIGLLEEIQEMSDNEKLLLVAHGGVSKAFSQKNGHQSEGVPGKCEIRSFDVQVTDGKMVNVTPKSAPINLQPEIALGKDDQIENTDEMVEKFYRENAPGEFERLMHITTNFVDEKIMLLRNEHNQNIPQSSDKAFIEPSNRDKKVPDKRRKSEETSSRFERSTKKQALIKK